MAEEKSKIKVLLFPEGDYLIAQCLDYDLAVQGRTIHKLKDRFVSILKAHVFLAKENGETPFENLSPAPAEYWRQWESGGKCIENMILTWPDLEWFREEDLPIELEMAIA